MQKFKEFIWPMVIIMALSLIFTLILQYYIIYNPVNPDVSIFSAAYKSLIYLIPYLILIILFLFVGSFAMILGFFVLIIGMFFAALYIGTLFLFVLPLLMAEGNNMGHALSRTFTLAHRNFWSNIGWVAVVALIVIVFSFIFSSLVLLPFSGNFLKVLSNPEEASNIMNFTSNPIYIVLSAIINALTFPIFPILASILYFNGKAREDNPEVAAGNSDDPNRVRVEDLYAKPRPENE
jgi:hypothetical protein